MRIEDLVERYAFILIPPFGTPTILVDANEKEEGRMRAREDTHHRKRRQMVSEGAHFRAVKYGFRGGDVLRQWLDAEMEVDAQLRQTDDRSERGKPKKKYLSRR